MIFKIATVAGKNVKPIRAHQNGNTLAIKQQ